MKIYEISTTVREDLIESYELYMREKHIPELLATGFFSGARFARDGEHFRIEYDATDLDGYLARDAERLRRDFLEHFPQGVELTRKTWNMIEAWSAIDFD